MNGLAFLAYLDPGTGSMVLQMLVGGILGGLLMIKLQWKRIVRLFSGKKPELDEPGSPENGSSSDQDRQ